MEYRLNAQRRDKENPNYLRRQGLVPGVVYGPGINKLVAFPKEELAKLLSQITRSSKIILTLDGEEFQTFIKEIQYDRTTDEVIHLDLYRPPAGAQIKMEIPLRLKGEPAGRRAGGVLHQLREAIKIKALPEKIPEIIELDVSSLDIGQAIHVRDLALPEVTVLTPLESPLVTVVAPRKEEELAPAAPEVGVEVPAEEAAKAEVAEEAATETESKTKAKESREG